MTKLIYKVIITLGVLLLAYGCRTKVQVVEIEKLKTEYRDRLKLVRDSIYLHDSVYITQRGDTIYRDRWRTHYRHVYIRDTAYIERRDSISYPVIVEVDKPKSWAHQLEVNAYRVVILLLVIYAMWHGIKRLLWRRRL